MELVVVNNNLTEDKLSLMVFIRDNSPVWVKVEPEEYICEL